MDLKSQPTITNNDNNTNNNVVDGEEQEEDKTTYLTANLSKTTKDRLKKLPSILPGLYNDDDDKSALQISVEYIRILLSSDRTPPIDEVIAAGILPRLVELISPQYSDLPQIQGDAIWSLINIASGTSEHTKLVVDAGTIPLFVQLLNSDNVDVSANSIWALGNLAGDSITYRDTILNAGVLLLLLPLLTRENAALPELRNGAWLFCNFFRAEPLPPLRIVTKILPVVRHLIHIPDNEVQADSYWCLAFMSKRYGDVILDHNGFNQDFVNVIFDDTSSPDVVQPVLRTIVTIMDNSTNPDYRQTFIIEHDGIVPKLSSFLSRKETKVMGDVCMLFSTILHECSADIVQAVMDGKIIRQFVLVILDSTIGHSIREWATIAMSNMILSATDEQLKVISNSEGVDNNNNDYFIGQAIYDALLFLTTDNNAMQQNHSTLGLFRLLRVIDKILLDNGNNSSSSSSTTVIHDIHNHPSSILIVVLIQQKDNVIEKLLQLQNHINDEIAIQSVQILNKYFGVSTGQVKSAGKII
jgi:hypothetical protein